MRTFRTFRTHICDSANLTCPACPLCIVYSLLFILKALVFRLLELPDGLLYFTSIHLQDSDGCSVGVALRQRFGNGALWLSTCCIPQRWRLRCHLCSRHASRYAVVMSQ